ncbi:MAG: hypothetical protein COA96_12745 [SAR86 cluster bacterium]|uniref:Uncharacterized protein n=1 Tax=SAR86 cluster bacterium TaxID=2030880 RepID=A0A2A5AUT9_9GAMM|nr:MAG: hypothetical protein COA96_12745 [SAR86 cluster bacterium]
MEFLNNLRTNFKLRPLWMNGLMLFCAFMTFIYLPWDVFIKPLAEDQEVWFGYMFTGWAAKAGAVLHWAVYGAGVIGFWKMKPWMFPWASLYTLQIAIGMFVWSYLSDRSESDFTGIVTAIPFLILAVALWRAKPRFNNAQSTEPENE